MKKTFKLSGLFILILGSCNQQETTDNSTEEIATSQEIALETPPEWAKTAIWYQIYPERFRNGDPNNDPTPEDMVGGYPGFVPNGWHITPWTQDWYKADDYFSEVYDKKDLAGNPIEQFSQSSRLRRYGGDLEGVLEKVDYLAELGVNAIYFNPLNDAPSDHKYDARNWRHIDRNFGPNPKTDVALMEKENPADPSTWKFTSADSLFLQVVDAFHQKGIRVIMDYSFNHTGIDFWAWKDLIKNQSASRYKDWYWVKKFDNPETPENEFEYRGWFGVKDLAEIKETDYHEHLEKIEAFEGYLADQAAKEHILNVARKWLDPNQDGDPSDGVDGFRLDVAVEMPLGFWRDFRKTVRKINPEAYLVGEVWWEKWPDDLMNPAPFVKGDIFDAVMHYRWYRPTRHFFAKAPEQIAVSEYVKRLNNLREGIRPESYQVFMNVAASHDSPRLATSLFNHETQYKVGTEPASNANYKLHKPDEKTWEIQKLLLIQQYTYLGAPHIWAGDEMGMWGADMGDARKPLIWEDYDFEIERVHPLKKNRPVDQVKFNTTVFEFYKKLTSLRQAHLVLSLGEVDFIVIDDDKGILGYSRYDENEEIIAVFNTSDEEQTLEIPVKFKSNYSEYLTSTEVEISSDKIMITLPKRTAGIFLNKP